MVPRSRPIFLLSAMLVNPTNPNAETLSRDLRAAARALGLELHVLHASTEHDFNPVFGSLAKLRAGGFVIVAAFFNALAPLTLHHAVPAITQYREFVAAGGLMSLRRQ